MQKTSSVPLHQTAENSHETVIAEHQYQSNPITDFHGKESNISLIIPKGFDFGLLPETFAFETKSQKLVKSQGTHLKSIKQAKQLKLQFNDSGTEEITNTNKIYTLKKKIGSDLPITTMSYTQTIQHLNKQSSVFYSKPSHLMTILRCRATKLSWHIPVQNQITTSRIKSTETSSRNMQPRAANNACSFNC